MTLAETFHWFVEYIVPYLNFFIFLFILVFFARNPMSQFVKKRKADFDAYEKAANEALNSARAQIEELQKRSKSLNSEIENTKKNAIAEAQNEAKRIVDEGKKLAAQILEDAKRMRDSEFSEAQKKLQDEVLALVKSAVVKKLETEFDEGMDRHFMDARIKEMGVLLNVKNPKKLTNERNERTNVIRE